MPKFRFRWADEDETFEGVDIYDAYQQLEKSQPDLPLDTTVQIDYIEEGKS